MHKKLSLFLTLIFILSSVSLFAAPKPREFKLTMVKSQVIDKSLYNAIEFLDSRPLHEDMVVSIDDTIFANQLQVAIDNLTDNSAQDNTLLLQLRHLYTQKVKIDQTALDLFLYIDLYEKKDGGYLYLNTLNTVINITSRTRFNNFASQSIVEFIKENLKTKSTSDIFYSAEDIENMDDLEKKRSWFIRPMLLLMECMPISKNLQLKRLH